MCLFLVSNLISTMILKKHLSFLSLPVFPFLRKQNRVALQSQSPIVRVILVFIAVAFSISLSAQNFPTFTLPPIPPDSIQKLQADANNFAYPFYTSLNVKQEALTWIADDTVHYALTIVSSGAYSLNVIFDNFFLPQGSLLTFSNANKQQQETVSRSPFSTPTIFASPLIADDTLIVHIQEPIENITQSHYVIGQISHGFKNIGIGGSRLRSADCHININCPEAAEWGMQKNSVCRLIIGGTRFCTGTLVNNTANDATPYVLTANHCLRTKRDALSTIFYFNYEYPDCEGTGTPPTNFTISGSELIATGKGNRLDFTLVRMSQTPPASFNVYYSGWDIGSTQPAGESCIHHPSRPSNGTKRLALSDVELQTKTFDEANTDGSKFIPQSHWFISEWSHGTTESGSSGSALLNASKQIIGILTGGFSSCANPKNDYFAKFSFAWDYNSEPQYRLKPWLDPINSGKTSCNGFFPGFAIDSIAMFSPQTTMLTVSSSDVQNWSGTNEMNMTCFANTVDRNNQFIIGITAGIHTVGDERGSTSFFVWNEDFSHILYEREIENSQLHANSANRIYFPNPVAVSEKFNIGVCYNQPEHSTGSSLFLIHDNSNTIDASFYSNARWTPYSSLNLNYNLALQPLITFSPYMSNPDYPALPYYSLPLQQSIIIPDNTACKIFPQPASDRCYVQFLNTWYQSIDCAIIDLHGSLMWSNNVRNSNGVHAIPLKDLPSGTYLLRVTAAGITQHFKIIKTQK